MATIGPYKYTFFGSLSSPSVIKKLYRLTICLEGNKKIKKKLYSSSLEGNEEVCV
jgi:hypothetical protein